MIFAHGGGWDELLFVLAPLAVSAALLWLAKRFGAETTEGEPDDIRKRP